MNEKDYKPFTAKKWTDIPKFEEVGEIEYSEEERKKAAEEFQKFLIKNGYIKEEDTTSQ